MTWQQRVQSFLSKVHFNQDGCWVWTGGKTGGKSGDGYGYLEWNDRTVYAHRFSYAYFVGQIPSGLCVLHHCDNPPCVRPDHLFLGTRADNHADAAAKGRSTRGSKQWNSKLKDSDIVNIRALRSEGVRVKNIAQWYGVNEFAIYKILNKTNWKHIQ